MISDDAIDAGVARNTCTGGRDAMGLPCDGVFWLWSSSLPPFLPIPRTPRQLTAAPPLPPFMQFPVSKNRTTATAKWNTSMLTLLGFGAGLAYGGKHVNAPCVYVTGMDCLHFV
jgi:hypothetical protein